MLYLGSYSTNILVKRTGTENNFHVSTAQDYCTNEPPEHVLAAGDYSCSSAVAVAHIKNLHPPLVLNSLNISNHSKNIHFKTHI